MTESSDPFMLGYPHEGWKNSYYTARVAEGVGVCLARMLGTWMVQFFPWNEECIDVDGQNKYVDFITKKAGGMLAQGLNPFDKWPFVQTSETNVLMIKCVIEDCVRQIGEINENHQRSAADPAAGTSVE